MKKYENPMLAVVSIKNNDIVTSSPIVELSSGSQDNSAALDAGRHFDDWDAGY